MKKLSKLIQEDISKYMEQLFSTALNIDGNASSTHTNNNLTLYDIQKLIDFLKPKSAIVINNHMQKI